MQCARAERHGYNAYATHPNTKRMARVEKLLLGESGMRYFCSIEFVLTDKHFRAPAG
jgi:hypothetical protein